MARWTRPRLVFGEGTSKVKYKKIKHTDDSLEETERGMLDGDHSRSSMESTAGIGSFIGGGGGGGGGVSLTSNFTFKVGVCIVDGLFYCII